MEKQVLQIERRGDVTWLFLNRPEAANAIDDHLLAALSAALHQAGRDPDTRAVVIAANGRSFCSGADIKGAGSEAEFIRAHGHPRGVEGWRQRVKEEVDLAFQVLDLPKPVVAAVHGHCVGFGAELAMACDIVLAADDASFATPEIRHASAPAFFIVPFVVGLRKAKDMLMLGSPIDASTAERFGMVSQVVPSGELRSAAHDVATKLAAVPETAMRLNKAALNHAFDLMGLRAAIAYNLETFVQIRMSGPAVEFDRLVAEKGLRAALEQRDRAFEGR